MSCMIVSDATIVALVSFALEHKLIPRTRAIDWCNTLWRENYRSFCATYPHKVYSPDFPRLKQIAAFNTVKVSVDAAEHELGRYEFNAFVTPHDGTKRSPYSRAADDFCARIRRRIDTLAPAPNPAPLPVYLDDITLSILGRFAHAYKLFHVNLGSLAIARCISRENQRNVHAAYKGAQPSVPTYISSVHGGSYSYRDVRKAVEKASANTNTHGTPNVDGKATAQILGAIQGTLDKIETECKAKDKVAAAAVKSDPISMCIMAGLEFKQGPSGNWLWRANSERGLRNDRIRQLDAFIWHRPIGADTREKCAIAAAKFCHIEVPGE
jgi:hypothetical protein